MELKRCSFETAKLLKEKGYLFESYSWYNKSGLLVKNNEKKYKPANGRFESYSAPTLELAKMWLRKVYNINIIIYKVVRNGGTNIETIAWTYKNNPWETWETYEEALEVGIVEALKL